MSLLDRRLLSFVVASSLLAAGLMVSPVSAAGTEAAGDVPENAPADSGSATVGTLSVGSTIRYQDQQGLEVFRVQDGYDLDQYLFSSSSPLDFSIEVNRDFGPVDSLGAPAPGNALYGKTGRITLRVYDVDDDYAGTAVAPEHDQLVINQSYTHPERLSGANDQWSINTFEFPLSHLRLPTADNPTGRNDFQVLIDVDNTGDVWAVEVDWAELRLTGADALPAGMIHGFNGDGANAGNDADFFHYEQFLRTEYPPLEGRTILPDTTPRGTIDENAQLLEQPIQQLLDKTGFYNLNLVTHSKGGLESRLYAWEHPGVVDDIVMLGTPNGGTPLADWFCLVERSGVFLPPSPAPWLVRRYAGECVPDGGLFQLTTAYVQNIFNERVRDRHGTEYFPLAGYGNGAYSWYLAGEDDGIVPVGSVEWLSRLDPDHPGKHDPMERHNITHSELIAEGSPTMPPVLTKLYPAAASADSQPASSAAAALAVAEEGLTVRFDFPGTEVPAGSTVEVPLTFEGAPKAGLMVAVDTTEGVSATINGVQLSAEAVLGIPTLGATLDAPADGVLQISNAGSTSVEAGVFVAVDTGRQMTISAAPELPKPGEPVTVPIGLTEPDPDDAPQVALLGPDGTLVADQPAVAVGPGQWQASVIPSAPGMHSVLARVEGSRPRSAFTSLAVASGGAQLTGSFTEALVDDDVDGLADALVLRPAVEVAQAGAYRVTATLRDAAGVKVAAAEGAATLPQGTGSVAVRVAGEDLFRSRRSGPYQLVDVLLSRDDAQGVAVPEHHLAELGTTSGYDFRQFEHFPVQIDPDAFADSAHDSDGDGQPNFLRVTGATWVDSATTYAINARLLTAGGQEIAEFQTTTSLAAGDNGFELLFPWDAIVQSGQDGPYTVADLSIYPSAAAEPLGYLVVAHHTAPYRVASRIGLDAGVYHSLALKSDGTAWAWGYNAYGQLGDATTTNRTSPVAVSNLSGLTGVAAGGYHSLAVRSDGTAWAWGRNTSGELGNGTTTNSAVPVQVSNLTGVSDVDGGSHHSLALASDGTVWAWGTNSAGQLGDGTTTAKTTPVQVHNLSGVTAIAAGGMSGYAGHNLALLPDGTVWSWGHNNNGQLGDGTTTNRSTPVQVSGLTGVVAVAANGNTSYALKGDGTVWAWGDNSSGQLANTSVKQKATTPVQSNITDVAFIAAGSEHALAVKTDGTAWGWGNNEYGQLGNGASGRNASTSTPVQVDNITDVKVLAGGHRHSLGALGDGTAWGWGLNNVGQLGDGTTTTSTRPVKVIGFSG